MGEHRVRHIKSNVSDTTPKNHFLRMLAVSYNYHANMKTQFLGGNTMNN